MDDGLISYPLIPVILIFQVCEGSVYCSADSILCGPVLSICKVERIQGVRDKSLDVTHDDSLEALYRYWSQSNRLEVIVRWAN